MKKVHTRESIIAATAPWIAEHKRLPRTTDWTTPNRPSVALTCVLGYFGTIDEFQQACVAAGVATAEMLSYARVVRMFTQGGRRRTTGKRGGRVWQ